MGLPGLDDLEPAPQLVAQRILVRERPLFVGRKSVGPEAPLREASQVMRQADRGGEGLAARHQAVGQTHPQSLLPLYPSAGQDQVHGVAVPDDPGQPHRPEIEQGDAEAAAEDPEDRILGATRMSHQSASSSPPATA